jgi:hypothetical protein
MVTPHSKTIFITSPHPVTNWKSYNLRVIQRINLFEGSFSRRSRTLLLVDSPVVVLTKQAHVQAHASEF